MTPNGISHSLHDQPTNTSWTPLIMTCGQLESKAHIPPSLTHHHKGLCDETVCDHIYYKSRELTSASSAFMALKWYNRQTLHGESFESATPIPKQLSHYNNERPGISSDWHQTTVANRSLYTQHVTMLDSPETPQLTLSYSNLTNIDDDDNAHLIQHHHLCPEWLSLVRQNRETLRTFDQSTNNTNPTISFTQPSDETGVEHIKVTANNIMQPGLRQTVKMMRREMGDEYRIICREVGRKGGREYAIVWLPDFYHKLTTTTNASERVFHELAESDLPKRLYLDIDIELTDAPPTLSVEKRNHRWQAVQTRLIKVLDQICSEIAILLGNTFESLCRCPPHIPSSDCTLDRGHSQECIHESAVTWTILDASNVTKFSKHVIFKLQEDRAVFKSGADISHFLIYCLHFWDRDIRRIRLFEQSLAQSASSSSSSPKAPATASVNHPYNWNHATSKTAKLNHSSNDTSAYPNLLKDGGSENSSGESHKEGETAWNIYEFIDPIKQTFNPISELTLRQILLDYLDLSVYNGEKELRMLESTKPTSFRPMMAESTGSLHLRNPEITRIITTLDLTHKTIREQCAPADTYVVRSVHLRHNGPNRKQQLNIIIPGPSLHTSIMAPLASNVNTGGGSSMSAAAGITPAELNHESNAGSQPDENVSCKNDLSDGTAAINHSPSVLFEFPEASYFDTDDDDDDGNETNIEECTKVGAHGHILDANENNSNAVSPPLTDTAITITQTLVNTNTKKLSPLAYVFTNISEQTLPGGARQRGFVSLKQLFYDSLIIPPSPLTKFYEKLLVVASEDNSSPQQSNTNCQSESQRTLNQLTQPVSVLWVNIRVPVSTTHHSGGRGGISKVHAAIRNIITKQNGGKENTLKNKYLAITLFRHWANYLLTDQTMDTTTTDAVHGTKNTNAIHAAVRRMDMEEANAFFVKCIQELNTSDMNQAGYNTPPLTHDEWALMATFFNSPTAPRLGFQCEVARDVAERSGFNPLGPDILLSMANHIQQYMISQGFPCTIKCRKETRSTNGLHYIHFVPNNGNFKYCWIKARCTGDNMAKHRHNNVYFTAKLNSFTFYQGCHNSLCNAQLANWADTNRRNGRSTMGNQNEIEFPPEMWDKIILYHRTTTMLLMWLETMKNKTGLI